jgi:hypothetical protein
VIWIARLAPVVLAISDVLMFGFGFLAGPRGAFVGLNLAAPIRKK